MEENILQKDAECEETFDSWLIKNTTLSNDEHCRFLYAAYDGDDGDNEDNEDYEGDEDNDNEDNEGDNDEGDKGCVDNDNEDSDNENNKVRNNVGDSVRIHNPLSLRSLSGTRN